MTKISLRVRLLLFSLVALGTACAMAGPAPLPRHGWWRRLGPVVPHETFPADCATCHVARNWQELVPDFEFDHEAETGVALEGAHENARCLRCHNDRGPVREFASRGCIGCHEDIHESRLGTDCTSCHDQNTWRPQGQIARHNRTRFPLVGVHAVTACHRCHTGAEVGRFAPTDNDCLTCHVSDLNRAVNPNHIGLGFTDNCQRCHLPTAWDQAEL